MNKILTILLLCFTLFVYSQEKVTITVLDKNDKQPLAFCNVWIKGTNNGTITNEDGKVVLGLNSNDIIIFSYIGYQQKECSYANLIKNKRVYLNKDTYKLSEVIVSADNDYLFDIILACREKTLQNTEITTSRAYFNVETKANDTILEFLECYYNAKFEGLSLKSLKYKHGRCGLRTVQDNYFLTMNTSKSIANISIIENYGNFPFIPLQLNKRKLKKYFKLIYLGGTDEYLKIGFESKRIDCFSGVVYIDNNNDILKLSLHIKDTHMHPFISMYGEGNENPDKLSRLNLNLNFKFAKYENKNYVEVIYFNYAFTYFSDRSITIDKKKTVRDINSQCLLYCYNYNKNFILPYIDINHDMGDYYNISMIPYNNTFWKYHDGNISFINHQRNKFNTLIDGRILNSFHLINETEMSLFGDTLDNHFFRNMVYRWNKNKRVAILGVPQVSYLSNEEYNSHTFNLKCQILLDVTDCVDSLHCRSYTIYDSHNTYYYFPQDSISNAFVNIYFDIYEIERRKMQNKFDANSFSHAEIDSIYHKTLSDTDSITSKYVKEVKRGKNTVNFNKWNQYIIDELGIDNISMSIESWKDKQAKLEEFKQQQLENKQ
ncbi:MAG: carboxypeptidase-like regulatory domain-containing protein [Bacteroidales bacterium]|nr:carboxypeptidase-like regulatory domain-containing protein [Bacteroidales bacterium]